MSFFHGITINETITGGVSIQSIAAAVIGLVGSAPSWAVAPAAAVQPPTISAPFLVNNAGTQGALGPQIQGYSIPYALQHILDQAGDNGVGQVIVVNVFNPATHNTAVSNLAVTMPVSGTLYVNAGQMGLVGPGLNGYGGSDTVIVRPATPFGDWAATTAKVLNNIIKPGTGNTGGYSFRCTTAGTTGSVEPVTWNQTVGGTTVDGSVTWTNIGVGYQKGTDYTVDYVNGLIYAKSGGAIVAGEALTISFSYCDPSKVADADLIGAVTSGVYTGMQSFLLSMSNFGFTPRILIAPGYGGNVGSKDQAVSVALNTVATNLRGFALTDSTPATTVATALSNRSLGTSPFSVANYRAVLCFPNLQFIDEGFVPTGTTINAANAVVNQISGALVDGPMSAWEAGAWSSEIVNSGFWTSPSNTPLNGPSGPDVSMYMSYTDQTADTNNLNAAGICTVMQAFATGLRTWGNRSSAFPTYTDARTFLAVRMALDVVEVSIQQQSLQFVDRPITVGLITSILASVNGYLRDVVRQGGLIAGSAISFNPGDNPATQLSAGIIVFEINLMPPPPAENITYNFTVNINLLNNLTAAVAQAAAA